MGVWGMAVSLWTDELKTKVRHLWDSHSASVISSILWEQDNVSFSRNAIISCCHRMQGKAAHKVSGPLMQKLNKKRVAPEPTPTVELRVVELQARAPGITITALKEGECRWPVNEVEGIHHFCGHPQIETVDISGRTVTHSYCAHHRLRGFGTGTYAERRAA